MNGVKLLPLFYDRLGGLENVYVTFVWGLLVGKCSFGVGNYEVVLRFLSFRCSCCRFG